jgi:hypothetical protein
MAAFIGAEENQYIFTGPFEASKEPEGFTFMVMVMGDEVELKGTYRPRLASIVRSVWGRKLTGGGPLPKFSGPVEIGHIPPTSEICTSTDKLDLKSLGLAKGDLVQLVVQHYQMIGGYRMPDVNADDVLLKLEVTFRELK